MSATGIDVNGKRRLGGGVLLAGVLIAAAFAVGGCGGSGGDGSSAANVASLPPPSNGSSSAPAPSGDPVAYSRCMRQNGVPDFPDPGPGGGFQFDKSLADTQAFKDAQVKCKQYMPVGTGPNVIVQQSDPNGNWSTADKIKYAKCMRDNGESKYPDPDANGNTIMDQSSGIDPNSPQFKKAEQACKQLLPQNLQGGGQTHQPGANS